MYFFSSDGQKSSKISDILSNKATFAVTLENVNTLVSAVLFALDLKTFYTKSLQGRWHFSVAKAKKSNIFIRSNFDKYKSINVL